MPAACSPTSGRSPALQQGPQADVLDAASHCGTAPPCPVDQKRSSLSKHVAKHRAQPDSALKRRGRETARGAENRRREVIAHVREIRFDGRAPDLEIVAEL